MGCNTTPSQPRRGVTILETPLKTIKARTPKISFALANRNLGRSGNFLYGVHSYTPLGLHTDSDGLLK